ncbi:MAG: EFR1 family ferrodoxin [Emergencia timonensis]|uniref:EFR1 family ferrodoxin n=1 Tax=Emergencia timonensis TaxID=1776384 RepID=UPI00082C834C|nr:EFR1 family ferrodoxin [Emergencia timonensis]WNX86837.1 EFR1 family ferrodoxin [Emergencia timonensis]
MNITRIWKVYFSPTGNTDQAVSHLADALRDKLKCPIEKYDFTLPASREAVPAFAAGDLVVFGTPVYAGKVPNKLLPFIQNSFKGNGAAAIPVVTFGNRSFDNGLAELTQSLKNNGFRIISAAAVASQHAFSDSLAAGRPDQEDLKLLSELAVKTAAKLAADGELQPVSVPGDAEAAYYRPLGLDGQPAVFLKAKPETDTTKCTNCGICARNCPMGSISPEEPSEVTGICIKCHACVHKCPENAKYFDDPAFLSHKAMLEKNFQRRAETLIIV